MARPLSDEKRTALLGAGIDAVSAFGVTVPALKIAKAAGVAEGTLFRYFPTKDDLLKTMYLDLKVDLIGHLTADLAAHTSTKAQFRHLWDRFIDWGSANPEKHRALRQLEIALVSQPGGAPTQAIAADLENAVRRGFENGVLREQPVMFMWGIIQAIADVVLTEDAQPSGDLSSRRELGWTSMWGAIASEP